MLLVFNFTKNNTPPWVFFTLFKLCKWYQIAQNITYIFDKVLMPLNSLMFLTTTKFDLVRPGYFSNANVFENLWLSWYHFLRSGNEVGCHHHLSHQFVIRQSMALKRKILWMAKAVTRMSLVKKVSNIYKQIPA